MKRFFKFCRCVAWVVRSSWRALPHGPYPHTSVEDFSICLWHLIVVMPFTCKSVLLKQGCLCWPLYVSGFICASLTCPSIQFFLPARGIECFCFRTQEKHMLPSSVSAFLFICVAKEDCVINVCVYTTLTSL